MQFSASSPRAPGKLLMHVYVYLANTMEIVSKHPALFAELISQGYSDDDLQKVARLNLIRVFSTVEEVCMYSKTHLWRCKTAASLLHLVPIALILYKNILFFG